MQRIDIHSHIIPSSVPDWKSQFGYGEFIHLQKVNEHQIDMMLGNRFFRRIEENCWDAQIRIDEYAQHNIQTQVVCTIPVLFSYWTKGEHGAQIARFLNDHIADLVARYPAHYIGLGTVPLQAVNLAIQEAIYLKSVGFAGIQIGSNINGKNLSEPEFFPFFQACADLGLALLIHPWEMMGEKDMSKYWLPWLVGMPAETTRAACSLIFSGILEKLPHLRVCFSHAGGSFLQTLGRIEHGYNCRPDLVAIDNPFPPSHYLGKFWIDSITHDIDMLEYCIKKIGADKICFGTDYPFPLGDLEFGSFITKSNLNPEIQNNIFSKNALDWLYGVKS